VEELVQECLGLFGLLQNAWKWIKDQTISTGPVCDERTGNLGKAAARKSLEVMLKVEKLVSQAENSTLRIESSAELADAVRQTKIIKDEIESTWPEIDHDMIQKSLESYKKGDFKTIEDLLNETESCGGFIRPGQPLANGFNGRVTVNNGSRPSINGSIVRGVTGR
jgi:hypothetical protein